MNQAALLDVAEYTVMTKCISSIKKLYFSTFPNKGIIKVIFCVTFDPTKSGIHDKWVYEKFSPNKLYFIEYNIPFNYIGPLQIFRMLYPFRTIIDYFVKKEEDKNIELKKLAGGGAYLYDYEEPVVEDIEDEVSAASVEVQGDIGIGTDGDFSESLNYITNMDNTGIALFYKDYPHDLYYNISEKVLYIKMKNTKVKGSQLEFVFTNISEEEFKIFQFGLFSGFVIYKVLYKLLSKQGKTLRLPNVSSDIAYNISRYQQQQREKMAGLEKDREQLFKRSAGKPYGDTTYGDIMSLGKKEK